MADPLIALLAASALLGAQYAGTYAPEAQEVPGPRTVMAPSTILIPAVPGRGIRDVPKIAIKYYDVPGKNFVGIVRSIEKQRPRDPATNHVMAGGAGYALGASMTKVTSDGKCTVTDAKAQFAPTAELPRLLNEQALSADQLALWHAYLSQIEAPAAAALWYVHDRLPAFEKSMIGKECTLATQVGSAAVAQLQKDYTEFQRQFVARYVSPTRAAAAKK